MPASLQTWVGQTNECQDNADERLARLWLATLDWRHSPQEGLPQGFHWCLAPPDEPTGQLGIDGHPARGGPAEGFLPPLDLPRRMWAASDIDFFAPLSLGDTITRRSRIEGIAKKRGRTGSMVFLQISHETFASEKLALRELQTLVYREAVTSNDPLSPLEIAATRADLADWERTSEICPTEALLFRYSALTFNSHRIHYDWAYARHIERYRGTVVQGPLTATLLLKFAQEEFGINALRRFEFRGVSPAICGEPIHLAIRGTKDLEIGALAQDGRLIMTGSATRK